MILQDVGKLRCWIAQVPLYIDSPSDTSGLRYFFIRDFKICKYNHWEWRNIFPCTN